MSNILTALHSCAGSTEAFPNAARFQGLRTAEIARV